MAITSIRLDPETQEILRVLGIPFIKIFRKGLVSYGLEGKIRDPRIQHLLKKYQQNLIDEMEAESRVLENLLKAFDKPESDVQDTHEMSIEEVIERPKSISPAMAEMLASDKIIPITFARNVILSYLKPLDKYNGNLLKVKRDLDSISMDETDQAGWIIVSGRPDLDNILEAGLSQAVRQSDR